MSDYGWPLDPGYRIEVFDEQDDVGREDVVAMWVEAGALDEAQARERAQEIQLVAINPAGEVVGATTSYLRHVDQLGLVLWIYRGFVVKAERRGSIATNFTLIGRDHLSRRYVEGLDRRGHGILYEIEYDGLKGLVEDFWRPGDFTFIGTNAKGDHVRVHYFPGALAPPPPQGRA